MATRFFSLGLSIVFSLSLQAYGQAEGGDFEQKFYQELVKESGLKDPSTRKIPNGLSTKNITPPCDPRRFEDVVMNKNVSTAEYFRLLKSYFLSCSSELTQNSTLGLLGLLEYSSYSYPFLSHPRVKEFLVKLPSGIRVPGILALKEDPRPRPLVIFKCGVFCSAAASGSMKAYLMHLFDQSPFNVLMVANQTGMDYIAYNKIITLGGWSEGFEALEIGKWMLEQWPYRDRISSVHFIGLSLGGNAAVMGAAFNDRYRRDNGQKIFNSVTAVCPVVSLKPTLEHLFSRQIVGRVFASNAKSQFLGAKQYLTDVPELISESLIPGRLGMADYIGGLASASLQKRGVASTTDSYFKSTNFWNWKEEVKTPLLVWASKDDMVVNAELNAQVMAEDDFYQNSPYVSSLILNYGNHCGFASAYGVQASAAVLRTFIMKHSPEFSEEYNAKQDMKWKWEFKKIGPAYEHVGQTWNFYAKYDKVKVSFKIFNWNGGGECTLDGPWGKNTNCVSSREYWIPISELKALGARIPSNDVEAQTLTREFNTKVEFRSGTKALTGTSSSDFYMTWRRHFE
ncbi:MAG: hypothetical protein AAGB31_11665 [Bdellovibrio sp.]